MTLGEAAQILEALARGIDPETGEVFPEDSPLNSTHVIRALFMGAKALGEHPIPPKAKRLPIEGQEHAWQQWTKEEEDRMVAAFDQGVSIDELAATHKRKTGGIRSRLIKLGRLEPSASEPGDA